MTGCRVLAWVGLLGPELPPSSSPSPSVWLFLRTKLVNTCFLNFLSIYGHCISTGQTVVNVPLNGAYLPVVEMSDSQLSND